MVTTCPGDAVLEQFLTGRVSLEQHEELAVHVEQCSLCLQRLPGLGKRDALVQMAQAPVAKSAASDTMVDALITRLIQLVPTHAAPELAGDETCQVREQSSPSGAVNLSEILRRPVGPGELGRLGPYRVLEVLGQGGMGIVFAAEDTVLKRKVALKALIPGRAGSAENRQRFLREAQMAAALDHDHIVPIFQVGEVGGVSYLAMPLLKGESLEDRLKRTQRVPALEILRIGREIALGLAAAHDQGLIHRDIKPANIWLNTRVKILDFGLARAADDQDGLTTAGTIVGTPAYMAPEQASGGTVDRRSDLFSLGCVLYRMATGQKPFQGTGAMQILHALANTTPPAPKKIDASVPAGLSDLIMRLLARNADERPANAQSVADTLLAVQAELNDETLVTPAQAAPKFVPPAVRPKRKWLLAAAGLAAAMVCGIVLLWPTPHGTVRIEVNDPAIKVAVDKGELVLVGKDGKDYRVAAGAHGLKVKYDKLEFDTETFSVTSGGTLAFKIDVIKGKLQVTKDGKLLVERDVTPADPHGKKTPSDFARLDKLDPATIPPEERFAWQPKELVAVLGEHRGRHWGDVRQVAYSPDGMYVATTGQSGTMLWDAKTLRQRAFLPGSAWAAAFSPDRKTLAVTANDQTVRLWDVSGGEPRERAVIHTGEDVSCLAFAPDGETLASGGRSLIVRLWDMTAAKPKEKAALKGHTAEVHVLTFAPNSKMLASAGDDTTVRLWDLTAAEPKEAAVLTAQTGGYRGLAFSPDGKTLASGGFTPSRLWDLTGGKPKEKAALPGNLSMFSMAFTPDGKSLACRDRWVTLLDSTGPEPKVRAELPMAYPHPGTLAISPDGKALVAPDGPTLRLWDLSGDKPQERLEPQGHTAALTDAVLAPDGKTLATYGYPDRVVRLWDLSGTAPRQRAELRHEGVAVGVTFAPDGKTLASSDGSMVRLWDLTVADPEARLEFKSGAAVHAVAFAPDGKTLACSDHAARKIHLWDVTGEKPKERAVLPNSSAPFAFAPDGKTLACNRLVKDNMRSPLLWDLSGAEPKERPELKPTTAALVVPTDNLVQMTWAPDGKTFACSWWLPGAPVVVMWDMSGSKPKEQSLLRLGSWYAAWPTSLAFAPDGRALAVATPGEAILWDVADRKKPKRRSWRLPGPVGGVTFAPDGRHLITANANGTAYILRLEASKK